MDAANACLALYLPDRILFLVIGWLHLCVCVYWSVRIYVCEHPCLCPCVRVCASTCVSIFMYLSLSVCVCVYECVYDEYLMIIITATLHLSTLRVHLSYAYLVYMSDWLCINICMLSDVTHNLFICS